MDSRSMATTILNLISLSEKEGFDKLMQELSEEDTFRDTSEFMCVLGVHIIFSLSMDPKKPIRAEMVESMEKEFFKTMNRLISEEGIIPARRMELLLMAACFDALATERKKFFHIAESLKSAFLATQEGQLTQIAMLLDALKQ